MSDDFEPFNPNNPHTQVLLLAQRVENLGREKEALEQREKELETRLQKVEVILSPEKMARIEAAIKFMDNAEFMGRWTWRGIFAFMMLSGGFYTAFTFWKSK